MDPVSILVLLTNPFQYRLRIDTSGIIAKPGQEQMEKDYFA
jgi:hypothetical protein